MAFVRLIVPLGLLVLVVAGCAGQERRPKVGDVGFNPRQEVEAHAMLRARNYYDYRTPKTGATIRSNPAGALVEWYNDDGIWVSVGNTPTRRVVIEATGKPELFRVSAPGYMSQVRWVAATRGRHGVEVSIELEPELPGHRRLIGK